MNVSQDRNGEAYILTVEFEPDLENSPVASRKTAKLLLDALNQNIILSLEIPENLYKNISEFLQEYKRRQQNERALETQRLNHEDVEKNKLANNKQGDAIDGSQSREQSLEDYDWAIQLNPNDPVAYYNRGLAYSDLQKHEKAIEDYDRAIELNSKYDDAYYNRGNTYHELQRYEKAIEDYDRAIELNPEYSLAHSNRELAYDLLKKTRY